MRNFAASEFNIINSYQFLLIHIFFPKYERNEWPRKRIRLRKDTNQAASIVVRYSIAIVHNDASVLGVLKEKKSELANYSLAAAIVNRQ